MLFRQRPPSAPAHDPRPALSAQQLGAAVSSLMDLATTLVFPPITPTQAQALGGFSFRGQEGFIHHLSTGIARFSELHDPRTIARAKALTETQERVWKWRVLEGLLGHLAQQAAFSRLAEQVNANRQGLTLLDDIERRMIDDYDAAQNPAVAAALFARNEAIVDTLSPATLILDQNRRRVRDRRRKLRDLRTEEARAAGLAVPKPRTRRKKNVLTMITQLEELRRAFAAARKDQR